VQYHILVIQAFFIHTERSTFCNHSLDMMLLGILKEGGRMSHVKKNAYLEPKVGKNCLDSVVMSQGRIITTDSSALGGRIVQVDFVWSVCRWMDSEGTIFSTDLTEDENS
jgi:hypothetical protein